MEAEKKLKRPHSSHLLQVALLAYSSHSQQVLSWLAPMTTGHAKADLLASPKFGGL